MSEVFLQKSILPLVVNDVIAWHVQHGWVFNAVAADGRGIGVVYVTLLGGDGCVVHFEILPGVTLPEIRSGFGKAFCLLAPVGRLLATVKPERKSLIKLLERFGFERIAGGEKVLLQFNKESKWYLKVKQKGY